ncbi:MAG: amidohydrolase family protein [Spirochaetes bacterium]|nr:amidohydrolase family protein [Spirochaetota bacterium]
MVDVLIKNATIIDGTGAKARQGDVGIINDRIVTGERLGEEKAWRSIDATGLAVSPGFIDVHSHHDFYIVDQDPVKRFQSFVRQGVTTCVVGNCGWSLAPCLPENKSRVLELIQSMSVPIQGLYWNSMKEYLVYIENRGVMCNIAQLAGHGTIRISVMGDDNRFCTEKELERMKSLLRESLDAGCVGVSSGLMYYPGMYAHTDELAEIARVAGDYGRVYATHLRGYCTTLPQSVAEAIDIARRGRVSLQISHLHSVPFLPGWLSAILPYFFDLFEAVNAILPLPGLPNPALDKGLKAIRDAMESGVDIGMDAVPYTLGNTTATVLFPPWANRGGRGRLLERIRDPESRERMRREIETIVPRWPHWEEGSWSDPYIRAIGWKPIRVLSVGSDDNRWTEGKTFLDIARAWKTDPFSALCRLTLEEEGEVAFTFGFPARPWIEKMFNPMLLDPSMGIGADSILPAHETGTPPPSAYGCFPRIIGHYSRKMGLFSLEEAVRKITGLPARRYRLENRGEIRNNAFGDLVVFDPSEIDENFTDDGKPDFAKGIRHVFINGQMIVDNGAFNGAMLPGRVLRA